MKHLLSILCAVLPLLPIAAQDLSLTIYSTNDLHGHILKESRDSIIDISRVAALKKNCANPVLLFDAGDLAYGMPVADSAYIEDLANLLNMAGYDAAVPGNHEFDGGMADFDSRVEKTSYPVLSANLLDAKSGYLYLERFGHGCGASLVRDMNGLKVGIFGLTTAKSASSLTAGKVDFETDKDGFYTKIARRESRKLRCAGADVVIAILHLGKPNRTADILSKVKSIDVIIDGDSHEEYVDFSKDSTRVLLQAGAFGFKIGKTVIEVERGKVRTIRARLLSRADVSDVPEDIAVAAAEARLRHKVNARYGSTGFDMPVPLWGNSAYFAAGDSVYASDPNRLVQTLEGKLWGRIMAEASAAADSLNGRKPLPTVVLKNGGSLREPLQAGDLSLTDLFRWCPNNGMVVATDASYSTLYRILSRSLDSVRMADSLRYSPETGSGAFLQWYGVCGHYDPFTGKKQFWLKTAIGDSIALLPDDSLNICTLIATEYVFADSASYGKIETICEKRLLGRELDIMGDYFRSSRLKDYSFVAALQRDLQLYGLRISGTVEENSSYKPSAQLHYPGLRCASVESVLYYKDGQGLIRRMDLSLPLDEYMRFDIPVTCQGPAVLQVECEGFRSDGKTPVGLYGSTYFNPALGSNRFHSVVLMREK
ncbi:MAG: bifunctional metallophosphatase/5'-nucleotidase [Bacteroidetes bacterium]|uniref:Bifunctional metallophosphatase/5'-nucleotidase n=1 Tax=Candidatus Enterocola intestinipullorum TaxID=2840783 RepID=A0A9D9EEU3_9BACT|nr:bifunctional metallophosphatase/5'-nucleotidase [Candidatus Enterocola intestinipullorum]